LSSQVPRKAAEEAGIPAGAVSVVVPVLNAARFIGPLIEALLAQLPTPPEEIILVDSHSEDETLEIASAFPQVRAASIDNFSHGAARNLGARMATGEFVVFLSQDALPVGADWLENLLVPFLNGHVAAAYSRQVPYDEANPMEKFFLETHFPPGGKAVRRRGSEGPVTFSDVFFSNVSSAVRRSVLLDFPFDEELIMSEDQKLSRDLIEGGYELVYQPTSVVSHSHSYTLRCVFQRYFDSVYSLTVIFREHGLGDSASIGLAYLIREFAHMVVKHPRWLPYYFCYVAAKTGGTVAGHIAESIPLPLRKKLSLHSYHWERKV
jgi:rhamnosyltransferase